MRYGLPYKGSKNSICEWIVDNLPPADTFCDLFCGGGAVTHRAMLTGKYKSFIMNDLDARLAPLFKECVAGLHTIDNHPEWISRKDFFRLKDKDAYIALVWSFGNNGKDYLYSRDIEHIKRAYHAAVFKGDIEPLKAQGYNIRPSTAETVYGRYTEIQRQIKAIIGESYKDKENRKYIELESLEQAQNIDQLSRLINVERLQALESLHGLQNLQSLQNLHGLESLGIDYQKVKTPPGALIYCDIPYKATNCGKYAGFDHERFYAWARQQDNIFISEYQMPDDFIEYANIEKAVLSTALGAPIKAIEKIFTNKRTFDSLPEHYRQLAMLNRATQPTLFDIFGDL